MVAYKHTHSSPDRHYGWGPDWQDGDIAFLKSAEEFDQAEYETLIKPDYLRWKATKHPVIILEHSKDYRHFLVTTVSAYSSGAENGFLPPWKQPVHRTKSPGDFRSFTGSAKPDEKQQHLQLANGDRFPKIKTSWVYIPNTFVVPSSVLKNFDKAKKRLRMDQTSLKGLLRDMEKRPSFANRWTNEKVLRILGQKSSQTRKEPKFSESRILATSSDDDSVATASTTTDSKPNTPSKPTTTISWAAVARSPPRTPTFAPIASSSSKQSTPGRNLSCHQQANSIQHPHPTTIPKCYA
ncbi:hypothetical protein F5Y05DRAFT_423303 [Hypoxylon sp. FL0543]|nr:hypothetical protein F5Y05DRAFT_423303 [Hypoxylon sp. FL0543]